MTAALSQGVYQELVVVGHPVSLSVTEGDESYSELVPVNVGEGRELAEAVTTGQFEKWRAQQELNLQPLVP